MVPSHAIRMRTMRCTQLEIMTDKNQHRLQANRASIRAILLEEWDPIGIRAKGGPDHEYDRYIDGIYALGARAQ